VGIRADYVTRPRELIANILGRERRFLSAAEIHHDLEAAHAKVSLSTVYRTLDYLQSKGEVTSRSDSAGETAYMLCEPERHHHHAICRICGRVEDVDCAAMDSFTDALRTHNGFELDGHAMEFFGKCRACRT
jgi:Fur family transcriptional regulator, ferric uptake regulator